MQSFKKKKPFIVNLKPSINKIAKYVAGENIKGNSSEIIKLSSNESPFLLPPKIRKISEKYIFNSPKYPDGDNLLLKSSLSKRFSLNVNQIICGNGSDDILALIGLAFTRNNTEIICSRNGFIFYPIIAQSVGAKLVYAETENLEISLKNILKKITKSTSIIFFANPNNPSGSIIFRKELINFLNKVPSRVLVVLDGAYAEYVTNKNFIDGTNLVKKFPNLIVTRTFSKIFAMAGFRVGWGYASKEIINILEKIRGPFNVNLIGQIAATQILNDKKFFEKSIQHNQKWKKWLSKELKSLGFKVYQSYGNFILVKNLNNKIKADDIILKLKQSNILIRGLKNYGLKNHLRITIGLPKELKILVKNLQNILQK